MSLAQHVASTEGADREWLEPLAESENVFRRVLSYDPIPPRLVEDQADHIAAYKVSRAKRACESIAHNFRIEYPTYTLQSKCSLLSWPAGSHLELCLASLL
jgi:hypothetical protein